MLQIVTRNRAGTPRRSPLYYDHVMEIPIITNFISRLERFTQAIPSSPARPRLISSLIFRLSSPLCRVSNYLNRCKYSRLAMFRFLLLASLASCPALFFFPFRYRRLLVRRLSLFLRPIE